MRRNLGSFAFAALSVFLGQIIFGLAATSTSSTVAAVDPCKTKSRTSAHSTFCDKYFSCGPKNSTVLKDCPNGLVYLGNGRGGGSPLIGRCEYAFNVDCSGRPQRILLVLALVPSSLAQQQSSGVKGRNDQINPCDAKTKIVSDATYCDRYWECVNGLPELYDCPNGLAFAGRNRGVADGCDYPWRGNYCEGRQLANPPISTEHCDWLYGIFGHETSCTRYWTCWNGTATEQLCIGGLLFSEESHSCDWPENVPGCQKHPLCKDDPNGNVPLGKSCNRYWNCQGGYPRLQRCPAMLVFDKRSLRCVVPPTDECDIPSTTPPPPEEQQEQEDDRKPQQSQQQQQQNRPNQGRQQQQQQSAQNRAQQQRQQQQQQQQREQPVEQQRPNLSPSIDNQGGQSRNQGQSQQQQQQQRQ